MNTCMMNVTPIPLGITSTKKGRVEAERDDKTKKRKNKKTPDERLKTIRKKGKGAGGSDTDDGGGSTSDGEKNGTDLLGRSSPELPTQKGACVASGDKMVVS